MELTGLVFVDWKEKCALGLSSHEKAETGNSSVQFKCTFKCTIMTRKEKQFNSSLNSSLRTSAQRTS